MANKYTKALKQIKSTQIDEKIKKLDEKSLLSEAPPTNSMSGVYALNDPGWHNTKPEPPRVFVPDKDGNWPAGIPANPGDKSYTRPAGYWDGTKDWETIEKPVASNANIGADGKNTKGLIDDETGYVKTDLPDGTRGFVLGPLVDNYVYLHGYDAYCNIGYMQKDTRQFVLLGRVNGRWNTDVHPIPSGYAGYGWGEARVWDGSESGFTSYNPSFTHAHALWFKEQIESRRYGTNVAYFYSGGVPAQNNPGEYSNLPQWLQDLLEGMKGGLLAGLGKFMDGNSAVAGAGANANDPFQGFGQGGDPDQITPGKEHTQGDPKTGDSGDANLWGQLWDNIKKSGSELLGTANDVRNKASELVDDYLEYAKKPPHERLFDDVKDLLKGVGFVSGVVNGSALTIGSYLNANTLGRTDSTEEFLQGGLDPYIGKTDNILQHGAGLALNLLRSMATGKSVITEDNNISDNLREQLGNSLTSEDITTILNDGFSLQPPNALSTDADSILNPTNKREYRNGGAAGEGGSIIRAGLDRDGNPVLFETADKFTRIGNEAGGGFDLSNLQYADVPQPNENTLKGMVDKVLNSGVIEHAGSVGFMIQDRINNPSSQLGGLGPSGSSNMSYEQALEQSREVVQNEDFKDQARSWVTNPVVSQGLTSLGTGNVNGTVTGALVTSKVFEVFGLKPQSELEQAGASGHNRRNTTIKLSDLKPEQQKVYLEYLNNNGIEYNNSNSSTQKESYLSESRSRILREIKQPVEVKEEPIQKLKKYRPNFKGKYRPQNTPDVTASPKSDQLVASGNQKGQAWRTKDKYWSGFESTERMNVIYDRVGHGNQAWEQIIEDAKKKNGWKNREVQEQINRYYALEAERKQGLIQETSQNEREDNFDKVVKLKSIIGNLKTWQGDIKPEYPDEKPPELGPDGFHPQLGKKKDYYKRLDSVSAVSMPKTGDPETDATVDQQKKKYVQPKVAEDTRFNWRDSLTNS